MAPNHRRYEENRLRTVLDEINRQIEEKRSRLKKEREAELLRAKTAWEQELPAAITDFKDLAALATEAGQAAALRQYHLLSTRALANLKKMSSSPYFARIDFRPSFSDRTVQIYIGRSALIDGKTGTYLVFDWRAPVSSMFYDYELGPAQYTSLRGSVSGEILLKRQFKIENGRLRFMFDNSLTIDDDVLQEVLSRAGGEHMKTIVNTIQKEQNRVIRNEEHEVLVVQGVAGSGKTSIALHRAAYLLYRHRNTLSSDNIVVFSPNRVFSDYISDVLPELGESNAIQTTFRDFAEAALGGGPSIEDVHDQLEYMFIGRGPALPSSVYDRTAGTGRKEATYRARLQAIRWKSSLQFVECIKAFAHYLEHEDPGFRTIVHNNKVVITQAELLNLLKVDYAYMPLHRRLDKIRRRVLWLLEPLELERRKEMAKSLTSNPDYAGYLESDIRMFARQRTGDEFRPIRNLANSWTARNVLEEYVRLFSDNRVFGHVFGDPGTRGSSRDLLPPNIKEIRKNTVASISSGFIRYEDLGPLLLLKDLLEGLQDRPMDMLTSRQDTGKHRPISCSEVKHVIIDEAQDYGLPQYEILKRVFSGATMTILGDLNQSVHPHFAIGDYEVLDRVFQPRLPSIVRLYRSYRSTRQIMDYAAAILQNSENLQAVDRQGPLPAVIEVAASQEQTVANKISHLLATGTESIAVICKTAGEAQMAHEQLKNILNTRIYLVGAKDRKFVRGVVVIPSYLAKGLEFQAVLVWDAGENHYSHPDDRKLLHMICTRALHMLILFYSGSLSPLLAGVKPQLFEHRGLPSQ